MNEYLPHTVLALYLQVGMRQKCIWTDDIIYQSDQFFKLSSKVLFVWTCGLIISLYLAITFTTSKSYISLISCPIRSISRQMEKYIIEELLGECLPLIGIVVFLLAVAGPWLHFVVHCHSACSLQVPSTCPCSMIISPSQSSTIPLPLLTLFSAATLDPHWPSLFAISPSQECNFGSIY